MCSTDKKHWDEPIWLHDAIDIPDIFKEYVPNIKINLFEVAYMTREQLSYFHSDFRIVADYFIQKREKNDYIPSPDKLVWYRLFFFGFRSISE